MNGDTFHAFKHKYLFVIQLRFKENPFLRVQTYHFRHRYVKFLVFVYFQVLVLNHDDNKWYLLTNSKINAIKIVDLKSS